MQLEVPLLTGAATYDHAAAEHLRITRLALHGRPVTLRPSEHGSVVVASFHGGQLHVSPVAKVVQLRPSLGHVDAADERRRAEVERNTQQAGRGAVAEAAPRAEEADAEADEEDGDGAPQQRGLHLLQTRIRRPDAQSAQSLARAHEEAEQWLPLMVHGERSPISTAVLHHLRTAHAAAGAAGQPVSAAAYLEALLPKQTHVSAAKASQQAHAAEAREVREAREPAARASGRPRPGPALDALPAVLHAMVTSRGHFLVSAGAVRDLLRLSPAAAGVRGATELSDEQLAQGLGSGWVAIQGRLVASTTGDAVADPVRAKVVALLKAKAAAGDGAPPSLRKQDVTAVAGGELGAGPSSLYTRVMRSLCDSTAGGVWVLRAGEAPSAEGARRRAKKGAAGEEGEPMDEDGDELE